MEMHERLDHAREALQAYFSERGEPVPEGPWDFEDTDASDLIADLLHLQRRLGLRDIHKTLQTALMHYEAEEAEPCASDMRCSACESHKRKSSTCKQSGCFLAEDIEHIEIVKS